MRSPITLLRGIGFVAVLELLRPGAGVAFPLIDPSNQDQVPQGTEMAAPDVQDLQHHLQLANGLAAPVGGGWTFVPRIDLQEMLTDNVEELHSPRRWDLVSYVAPGFNLAGDLPRVQATVSYAPTLALYAQNGSLNALTQQLNALATITLAPDLAFVDVRAVSGVQSIYGGLGGLGTLGAGAGAGATAQTAIPTLAGNAQGLTRNNEAQTSSFIISPYLLRDLGDWGTGKLGYSFGLTRSDLLSGFASPPFPAGGADGQTLLTNEFFGHYATGEILPFLQNAVDMDIVHGQTTTDPNSQIISPGAAVVDPYTGQVLTGFPAPGSTSTSNRAIVSDTVTYALTRELQVFVSAGHEDIVYSNQVAQGISSILFSSSGQATPTFRYSNVPGTSVHDLTWSFGGTWTPNPDSSLTISYGHLNGFNSLTVNGHYQATARTVMTVSYGSMLGTQLEAVQNQLNLAASNGTGSLVNATTGGPLYGSTNALGVQNGIFRTDTLAVGSNTVLDRDIISINLLFTKQTQASGTTQTTTAKTINATWLHQMRPDMTLSAAISYGLQDQNIALTNAANAGNATTVAASLAWQYQISDTLSTSLRYSFLERQSPVTLYSLYQNMLILGISKTF